METFKLIMIEIVDQRESNMEIPKIKLWHKKFKNFRDAIKNHSHIHTHTQMLTLSNHPPSTLIKILIEFSSAESSSSLMKAFLINIFTHLIKPENTN